MNQTIEKPTEKLEQLQGEITKIKEEVSLLEQGKATLTKALEERKISLKSAEENNLNLDELISRRSQVIACKELLSEKEMQLSSAVTTLARLERQHYEEDAMNQLTDLAKALSDEHAGFEETLNTVFPKLKMLAKALLEKRQTILDKRSALLWKAEELLPEVKLRYAGNYKDDDVLVAFFRALEKRGVKQFPLRNALPLKADDGGLTRFQMSEWMNPHSPRPKETIDLDSAIENVAFEFIDGLEKFVQTKGSVDSQNQYQQATYNTRL